MASKKRGASDVNACPVELVRLLEELAGGRSALRAQARDIGFGWQNILNWGSALSRPRWSTLSPLAAVLRKDELSEIEREERSEIERLVGERCPWAECCKVDSSQNCRFTDDKDSSRVASEQKEVATALKEAYDRRKALVTTGQDTEEVDAEILDLRREQRNGPVLKPLEFLSEGRYQLQEKIGTGGFAEVWKAWDDHLSQIVAIKVLHGQYAQDVNRRERLFRGAQRMAELRDSRVVRVIEPKIENYGFYYFVMEHVSCGDLFSAVIQGRIDRDQALDIIESMASVIEVVHGQGLVHRDVKPRNILLREDGTAALTDFDLVFAEDTTGGTRTGAMGTWIYSAPEQNEDASKVDCRVDVYSLGMTAVFCVHGRELPRESIYQRDMFLAKMQCSDPLREVLRRAIAIKKEDRFETMAAFREHLVLARRASAVDVDAIADAEHTPMALEGDTGEGSRLESIRPLGRHDDGSRTEEQGIGGQGVDHDVVELHLHDSRDVEADGPVAGDEDVARDFDMLHVEPDLRLPFFYRWATELDDYTGVPALGGIAVPVLSAVLYLVPVWVFWRMETGSPPNATQFMLAATILVSQLALLYSTRVVGDLVPEIRNSVRMEVVSRFDFLVSKHLGDKGFVLSGAFFAMLNMYVCYVMGLLGQVGYGYGAIGITVATMVGLLFVAFACGMAVWGLFGLVSIMRVLTREGFVVVDLGHPDGRGGVGYLGNACTKFAIVTAVVGAMVSTLITMSMSDRPHGDIVWWLKVLWILWPLVVTLLTVLGPVSEFGRLVSKARGQADAEIGRMIRKVKARVPGSIGAERERMEESLGKLGRGREAVLRVRASPFGGADYVRFMPFIVVQLLVSLVQLGIIWPESSLNWFSPDRWKKSGSRQPIGAVSDSMEAYPRDDPQLDLRRSSTAARSSRRAYRD